MGVGDWVGVGWESGGEESWCGRVVGGRSIRWWGGSGWLFHVEGSGRLHVGRWEDECGLVWLLFSRQRRLVTCSIGGLGHHSLHSSIEKRVVGRALKTTRLFCVGSVNFHFIRYRVRWVLYQNHRTPLAMPKREKAFDALKQAAQPLC